MGIYDFTNEFFVKALISGDYIGISENMKEGEFIFV